MPYKIIKRKCKQSSGKKGKYIVAKKSDNKKQSCHTSKKKAQSAVRARYANESEIREYIKLLIESNSENHVSFKDILKIANAEAAEAAGDAEKAEDAENAKKRNNYVYPPKPKKISPEMEALLKLLGGEELK